jgi:hypothetical protein
MRKRTVDFESVACDIRALALDVACDIRALDLDAGIRALALDAGAARWLAWNYFSTDNEIIFLHSKKC